MFVAGFSTGVQHVILVMSMGFLTGKTLSGVFVVHIVCIGLRYFAYNGYHVNVLY